MQTNSVRIELIREMESYEKLQKEWERLAFESNEVSVYNRPDLLSLWWKHFGMNVGRPFIFRRGINLSGESSSAEDLFILVARYGSQIVGILPLMKIKVKLSGEKHIFDCLHFLGDPIFNPTPSTTFSACLSEQICSSMIDFIKSKTDWDAVILGSLREDWQMLSLFVSYASLAFPVSMNGYLEEKQFLRCWSRDTVNRKLLRLIKELKAEEAARVRDFSSRLMLISDKDFALQCLPAFDVELRRILMSYESGSGRIHGIVQEILKDIAQLVPYNYKVLNLEDSGDGLEKILGIKKRWEIKRDTNLSREKEIEISISKKISESEWSIFVEMHKVRHPKSAHLSMLSLDYYRQVEEVLLKDDLVYWIVARQNSKPLALGLFYHDKYLKSLDAVVSASSRSEINLGDLIKVEAIKLAKKLNCNRFGLRMGAETYKERFKGVSVRLRCFIAAREFKCDLKKFLPSQWSLKVDAVRAD